MSADITLTAGQLRALRILDEHELVQDADHTCADGPRVSTADGETLGIIYLVDPVVRPPGVWWRIRAKGRQVLRDHDAAGVS